MITNDSLESHNNAITFIAWNEQFNKLTTSDSSGKIVVWVNNENEWCEEMVNKRNGTSVTGVKWSPDGQNICMIYNDGVIMLGSLEGNRIWIKEIKDTVITHLEVLSYLIKIHF